MSISVYQCSVCSRKIELLENKKGLDCVDRCIITNFCKGHLTKITSKQEYVTGKRTPIVAGIDDWVQRKSFYQHTQSLASTVWVIRHNLNCDPSIQAFTGNPPVENSPIIKYIDSNTTQLTFVSSFTGVAHCVARSSTVKQLDITPDPAPAASILISSSYLNLPAFGDVVIGILGVELNSSVRLAVTFIQPSGLPTSVQYQTTNQGVSTTWNAAKVRANLKVYGIKSFNLNTSVPTNSKCVFDGFAFTVVNRDGVDTISFAGNNLWKFVPGFIFYIIDPVSSVSSKYTVESASLQGDTTHVVVVESVPNSGTVFDVVLPFAASEAVILFANPPYAAEDKNSKQLVQIANISPASSLTNLHLIDRQLVATPQIVSTIYPEIISL